MLKTFFYIIGILVATLSFTSCVKEGATLTRISNAQLGSSYGYAAIRIKSNKKARQSFFLERVGKSPLSMKGPYAFRSDDASEIQLLKLPAGRYRWVEYNSPFGWKSLSSTSFDVLPLRVNYLGDMDVMLFSKRHAVDIIIRDNRSQTQQELLQKTPGLITRYPMRTEIATISSRKSYLQREIYVPSIQ